MIELKRIKLEDVDDTTEHELIHNGKLGREIGKAGWCYEYVVAGLSFVVNDDSRRSGDIHFDRASFRELNCYDRMD